MITIPYMDPLGTDIIISAINHFPLTPPKTNMDTPKNAQKIEAGDTFKTTSFGGGNFQRIPQVKLAISQDWQRRYTEGARAYWDQLGKLKFGSMKRRVKSRGGKMGPGPLGGSSQDRRKWLGSPPCISAMKFGHL